MEDLLLNMFFLKMEKVSMIQRFPARSMIGIGKLLEKKFIDLMKIIQQFTELNLTAI